MTKTEMLSTMHNFVFMRVQFHDTTLSGTAAVNARAHQHSGECDNVAVVASTSVVHLVIASIICMEGR